MFKNICCLILVITSLTSFSQELTGKELLDKAIQYHDPNGNWAAFNGKLVVTMTIPDKPERVSTIHINLPNEFFSVAAKRGDNTTEYIIDKGDCTIAFNGLKNPSEAI
ncbi:DUF6503 family protein [Tenacibaculum amylolyticum]|uniref:DUF6503 family protein n=1 Tax=Tenacibaculum amylolyticum TaxID=104269 RepID=UPI0038934304